MSLTVMLLAYNESSTIERQICEWEQLLESLPAAIKKEILVVEDGSTDGTTEILQSLAADGRIIHSHQGKRAGYNSAFLRGLSLVETNYLFYSDSGSKNDLLDFWALYLRKDKADILVGRKAFRRDQRYRRFLTYSLNLYLRKRLHTSDFFDVDSGFRLMNRDFVESVNSRGLQFKGFAGCELALHALHSNFKYLEVPVSYSGRSDISRGLPPFKIPKAILQLLWDIEKLIRSFN